MGDGGSGEEQWGEAVGGGGGNSWEGGQKPRTESMPEGGSGKPHHAYGDKAASGLWTPLCVCECMMTGREGSPGEGRRQASPSREGAVGLSICWGRHS